MSYPGRGPSRRDKWKARVLKTPTISHGTRLFLLHTLSKHMKADGFVQCVRERFAREAGISERQVTRYISNAVGMGWLQLVNKPGRGVIPLYQATFPDQERVTQDVTLYEPERVPQNVTHLGRRKGDANKPPLRDQTRHPLSGTNRTRSSVKNQLPYKDRARTCAHHHSLSHLASSLRLSSPTGWDAKPNEWLGLRHLGSFQPGRCHGRPGGAAPLSGLESCKGGSQMRSGECQQVEKQKRNEGESLMTDAWGVPPRCDSPGCFQGVTWMRRYCGRCGGSGYLTPANHTIAARAGRAG